MHNLKSFSRIAEKSPKTFLKHLFVDSISATTQKFSIVRFRDVKFQHFSVLIFHVFSASNYKRYDFSLKIQKICHRHVSCVITPRSLLTSHNIWFVWYKLVTLTATTCRLIDVRTSIFISRSYLRYTLKIYSFKMLYVEKILF